MLPPLSPCLPSAAHCCCSPSTANKTPSSALWRPDSPPHWPDVVPLPQESTTRVEIRCSCQIELMDAQFVIWHNEQTNDFFAELFSADLDSAPVLSVLFRFVPSQLDQLHIFIASYGHWRPSGSVQQFLQQPTAAGDGQSLMLAVRVFEQFYSVELNGREVERVQHRRPFALLRSTIDP